MSSRKRDDQVEIGRSCPSWVKNRHGIAACRCPLYPRKRTSERSREMSALGHKRTPAPQQRKSLFNHLVGDREQV
jgi:hypothetical protein